MAEKDERKAKGKPTGDESEDPKKKKGRAEGDETKRKVSLGADALKTMSEWVTPVLARLIAGRIPADQADLWEKAFNPITATAILQVLPDDKFWSPIAEDIVSGTIRDTSAAIKRGETRDAAKPKEADKYRLDPAKMSESILLMLDQIHRFAETLDESQRQKLNQVLSTAKPVLLDRFLAMSDDDKRVRLQAMIDLETGGASPKGGAGAKGSQDRFRQVLARLGSTAVLKWTTFYDGLDKLDQKRTRQCALMMSTQSLGEFLALTQEARVAMVKHTPLPARDKSVAETVEALDKARAGLHGLRRWIETH